MPRDPRNLPRIQLRENSLGQRLALALETCDFLVDVDLGIITNVAQLFDLRLELGDRLLKIQELHIHIPRLHDFAARGVQ